MQVAPMQQFEIVSETTVHSRYLSVYDRQVKFCATENPSAVSTKATMCIMVIILSIAKVAAGLCCTALAGGSVG